MRKIDKLLSQYSESHQNKSNIFIHGIAVPSIFFVTVGLIWSLPVSAWLEFLNVTWAHVAVVPTMYFYFRLSGPIGAAMTLLILATFGAIALLEYAGIVVWQFCLVLFVIMWILQFIGHKIEGKAPSFFQDLRFLLIGPAWWWVHWLKRLNINY